MMNLDAIDALTKHALKSVALQGGPANASPFVRVWSSSPASPELALLASSKARLTLTAALGSTANILITSECLKSSIADDAFTGLRSPIPATLKVARRRAVFGCLDSAFWDVKDLTACGAVLSLSIPGAVRRKPSRAFSPHNHIITGSMLNSQNQHKRREAEYVEIARKRLEQA